MSDSLSIPSRFNGPLESGNGGYCSGVVASFLEGAAEVSLRRPVRLDTPLDVVRENDGSARGRCRTTPIGSSRAGSARGRCASPLAELKLATLDCTGGFNGRQRWTGVRLARRLK